MKIRTNIVLFIIMFMSFAFALLSQTNEDTSKVGKSDVIITAEIRQDIMKQKDLSTSARNIQIFTSQGRVTLKGPVRSEAEKNSLIRHANAKVGTQNVMSEISVNPEKSY